MNSKAGSEGPLGFGLLVVSAVVMTIATFLPFYEPTGAFSMVKDNTLIQLGGWWFIVIAVAIAGTGYRVCFHKPTQYVLPIINCGIAAVYVIYLATDKQLRTLYPVGPNGAPDITQPGTEASLGIAVYVAGVGVAAASIGSFVLARSAYHAVHTPVPDEFVERALAERATKKCPDCAETVLADAKVCKHCGYRFASTGAVGADPQVIARG